MAFAYYKTLTLDHTQCGSANSTDWPLTISLDGNVQAADPDLKTIGNSGFVQNSNGYDIRPYDNAGSTPLTYELVFYDGTTGKLEMHVKISTLSSSVDTVIRLYFGDASLTTDGSSSSTWNSNFKAVWHFKDGTTLSFNDSTSNALNGTNHGTTATVGQVDGGVSLVRASAQYIGITALTDLSYSDGSISWWANSTIAFNSGSLVSPWGQIPISVGQNLTFQKFSDNNIYAGWSGNTEGRVVTAASASNWPQNTWIYYSLNWTSGGNTSFYYNGGNVVVNGGSTTVSNNGSDFIIGTIGEFGVNNGLYYFDGKMDEIRISNVLRSTDWQTADYNCQKTSSTFITWSSKVPVTSGSSLRFNPLLNGISSSGPFFVNPLG